MTQTWNFVQVKRKPKKRKPRKGANRALVNFILGLVIISWDIVSNHVTYVTGILILLTAATGVIWAFYTRPRGGHGNNDDDEGGAA